MKFSCSLKLNHIFQRLYHTKGLANGYLVLYARPNRTATNRVGVTVGKKLGKAVVRNRVRRRLREIWRLNKKDMEQGWDIILVARVRAVETSYQKLEKTYLRLLKEVGLLKETEE